MLLGELNKKSKNIKNELNYTTILGGERAEFFSENKLFGLYSQRTLLIEIGFLDCSLLSYGR